MAIATSSAPTANWRTRQRLRRATRPFRFHVDLDSLSRFILDADDRTLTSEGAHCDSTFCRDAAGANGPPKPAPLHDLVSRCEVGAIIRQGLHQANDCRLCSGKSEGLHSVGVP